MAIQILPGPEADQWIEWACGLHEPADSVFLQALANRFPRLDDFVANLEPGMWRDAELPISGTSVEPRSSIQSTGEERLLETIEDSPVEKEAGPIRMKEVSKIRANSHLPQPFLERPVPALGVYKKSANVCIYRRCGNGVAVDPKVVDHEMYAHFAELPTGMGYYFHWDEVIASRIGKGEDIDSVRAYFARRLDQCKTSASQKERECRRNYQRLTDITDWLDQNFILTAATASVNTLSKRDALIDFGPMPLAEVLPSRIRRDENDGLQVTA
jgi:hypothetical protein